jgi:hypothetical protein
MQIKLYNKALKVTMVSFQQNQNYHKKKGCNCYLVSVSHKESTHHLPQLLTIGTY